MTAKRRAPNKPSEAEVLAACLALLRRHPKVAFAFRMNTGAMRREYVDRHGIARRHFVRFAFPGCSDILGMLRSGVFLAVECKAPGGRLTDDQAAFLEAVNTSNGVGLVVDNVQDLADRLKSLELREICHD